MCAVSIEITWARKQKLPFNPECTTLERKGFQTPTASSVVASSLSKVLENLDSFTMYREVKPGSRGLSLERTGAGAGHFSPPHFVLILFHV